MENKRISQFNPNQNPTNNDLLPIVNNGETKKITLSGLTDYLQPFFSGTPATDTYVTGVTYSDNQLTISQNEGQPDLNVTISGGSELPYSVYIGYIYFIKGGDPILYGARENTIGEELTLTKISDGALNINFPQGTSLDNVWVSPLIFKATNQGGKNDGDNFVTNTFLALQGERWNNGELGSPHRYCVALGSEYVDNIYMAHAVAEIEIRVYVPVCSNYSINVFGRGNLNYVDCNGVSQSTFYDEPSGRTFNFCALSVSNVGAVNLGPC